jgi:hypothetical protein
MATRIKTVEYWLGSSNTTLATATRRDFTQVAVRLPETSKVFRSVRLIVTVMDAQTTAATMTNPVLGIKIDAVAFSNATLGNPPANSGEHGAYIYERDVTSYFTTNFTTAQHNVGAGVQFTGPTTINHSAKIVITYEYDDTSTEHVKTVRIPIESGTGALTTTLTNIGTSQIPALDTFLPEASKTYRRVWIEAIYNDHAVGTVNDPTLGISVAGGAEQLTGAHFTDLASARALTYLFDQGATPSWTTSTTQNIQARSSSVTNAATFNHVAFLLCITYTFAPASTTRVLNSLAIVMPPIFTPGGTAATDSNEQTFDLWVQEPGTITLRQSGAVIHYSQTAAVGPRIRFGAQSERSYTDVNVLNCGAAFLCHRVDSGAAQGAGITVSRGKNTFEFSVSIATLGTSPCNFGGFLYVNYESDVSALGVGAHNQSLQFGVQDSQLAAVQSIITATQEMFLPSTHWYRSNLGILTNQVINAPSTTYTSFECESLTGELTEGGWENQGCVPLTAETELGWYPTSTNVGLQSPNDWQRWTGDPDTTRMSITGTRRWRVINGLTSTRPLVLWLTVHNIIYTVTSTISGSSGGTVTARLCRASDGTLLKSTTRSGNGDVTFTWYDNTQEVFVEARETDALVGRSGNGTATGSP